MGPILVVHTRYRRPGGEEAVVAAETELLRERGHPVAVWEERNDELEGMPAWRALRETVWSQWARRKLERVLREVRPDVVHVHNTFPRMSPAVYHACREVGVPVVQTLHNYRLLCPGALLMRDGRVCEECVGRRIPWPAVLHGCWHGSPARTGAVAAMLVVHRALGSWARLVDRYIALTDFARRKFAEGGLPAERIVVKPNFVPTDPGGREGPGDHALFVGRLSGEKGLRVLLEAWRRLPGVPLRIVGDGPLRAELEMRARGYGLDHVGFLGQSSRDEVFGLLRRTRMVVFPSVCYEGFPMTVAEAFACGVPVVASRLGAMAEIVEDGRTGLHFRPGDAGDLAARVEELWSDPHLAVRMGREARREYEAKYTAERNYGMLRAIYEEVIADHRARAGTLDARSRPVTCG